jgi:hypothetical protein
VSWLVSELVRGLLQFSPSELLLLEAGSCGLGIIREPRGSERPPLKTVARQRLVKTAV